MPSAFARKSRSEWVVALKRHGLLPQDFKRQTGNSPKRIANDEEGDFGRRCFLEDDVVIVFHQLTIRDRHLSSVQLFLHVNATIKCLPARDW